MRGQKQRDDREGAREMRRWIEREIKELPGTKPIKQQWRQWQRSEAGALVEPARF